MKLLDNCIQMLHNTYFWIKLFYSVCIAIYDIIHVQVLFFIIILYLININLCIQYTYVTIDYWPEFSISVLFAGFVSRFDPEYIYDTEEDSTLSCQVCILCTRPLFQTPSIHCPKLHPSSTTTPSHT